MASCPLYFNEDANLEKQLRKVKARILDLTNPHIDMGTLHPPDWDLLQ